MLDLYEGHDGEKRYWLDSSGGSRATSNAGWPVSSLEDVDEANEFTHGRCQLLISSGRVCSTRIHGNAMLT
jgi:hypothetical protein